MQGDPDFTSVTTDRNGVPFRQRLTLLREMRKLSENKVAEAAQLSIPEYYDLETYDGELTSAVSLATLSRIASVLQCHPSRIFEDVGEEGQVLEPVDLQKRLAKYISTTGKSISDLEDLIGFAVAAFLSDSMAMWKWNIDCLRAVCAVLEVDWLTALPLAVNDERSGRT